MKIINKIKARFDKIVRLEKELVQKDLFFRTVDADLVYYKREAMRLSNVLLRKGEDNDSLVKTITKLNEDIIRQSEDNDIKIKYLQVDLTKCQEHNTKLRQELDKAVKDLEISRASEKETKQLLLETMKLNNALNTRITRNEVSEPVGDKVNMEEIINLNKE